MMAADRDTRAFVYGTLMDQDLFECVTTRPLAAFAPIPARLPGRLVARVAGQSYPMIVEAAEPCAAHGFLLQGLGAWEWARLAAYETSAYARIAVSVEAGDRNVEAWAFGAGPSLASSGEAWDLARWQREHKQAALAELRAA